MKSMTLENISAVFQVILITKNIGGKTEFIDIGMSGDPKYFSKSAYIK